MISRLPRKETRTGRGKVRLSRIGQDVVAPLVFFVAIVVALELALALGVAVGVSVANIVFVSSWSRGRVPKQPDSNLIFGGQAKEEKDEPDGEQNNIPQVLSRLTKATMIAGTFGSSSSRIWQ